MEKKDNPLTIETRLKDGTLREVEEILERPATPSSKGRGEVESRQNARLDHELAGV